MISIFVVSRVILILAYSKKNMENRIDLMKPPYFFPMLCGKGFNNDKYMFKKIERKKIVACTECTKLKLTKFSKQLNRITIRSEVNQSHMIKTCIKQ